MIICVSLLAGFECSELEQVLEEVQFDTLESNSKVNIFH